ncbi:MAG: A/G-specific adenine glycosylase [Deltaproteobacteria bacterium]|nr:A/G-specific adenine glycosylase [Deltaproteobacteria bacterium]
MTEILLSKTRADAVEPVARRLFERFRHPRDLAAASPRTLEKLLYPLGLQRKRAQHLVKCAKALITQYNGEVPKSAADLLTLPYIGRYAASAIASVAFHQPLAVVDANVSRVYQRVFSIPRPPKRLSTADDLWAFAERVLPRTRFREFNWAILDLGGTVCTPRAPSCTRCPLASHCNSRIGSLENGAPR